MLWNLAIKSLRAVAQIQYKRSGNSVLARVVLGNIAFYSDYQQYTPCPPQIFGGLDRTSFNGLINGTYF